MIQLDKKPDFKKVYPKCVVWYLKYKQYLMHIEYETRRIYHVIHVFVRWSLLPNEQLHAVVATNLWSSCECVSCCVGLMGALN